MLFLAERAFESTTAPHNVQCFGKRRCSVIFKRLRVSLSLASVILEAAVQYFSMPEGLGTWGRNC